MSLLHTVQYIITLLQQRVNDYKSKAGLLPHIYCNLDVLRNLTFQPNASFVWKLDVLFSFALRLTGGLVASLLPPGQTQPVFLVQYPSSDTFDQ